MRHGRYKNTTKWLVLISLQTSDKQTMALSQSHSTSETAEGNSNKADLISSRSDMETAALAEDTTLLIKSLMCVFSLCDVVTRSSPPFLQRRKVDWRLLPLLGFLSALSLIDRSNLGLARAAGLDHDLVCFPYSFTGTCTEM